jgi:hypothetical protein
MLAWCPRCRFSVVQEYTEIRSGFPDDSAVAVAPAPALTQTRPREEGLI